MNVLDLFSGIGGFSLGLDRAGMKTVAFCEIEDYPRTILKKHWPDVPIYKDIRQLTKEDLVDDGIRAIDVICGGFPCQPFSVAGQQRGKDDERHLWPEMLRLIREIKPTFVIGENVAGFIPLALDDVLSDLESEGYTCQTFVIPACAVGGIHRRDRVWIIGYAKHNGQLAAKIRQGDKKRNDRSQTGQNKVIKLKRSSGSANVTHTPVQRLQRESIVRSNESVEQKPNDKQPSRCRCSQPVRAIKLPTQPAVCHRDNGFSDRVVRLKALGNAVVPQIPEMIGRAIMQTQKGDE